jgi:hypothetical protein
MASKRTRNISILAVAGTLGGIALASSHHHYDYNQVCVDQQTQQRVNDNQCNNTTGYYGGYNHYGWYSIPTNRGTRVAGVGETVSGGSYAVPPSSANVARGVVPSSGGKISRGGFGHTSGGDGSVGG